MKCEVYSEWGPIDEAGMRHSDIKVKKKEKQNLTLEDTDKLSPNDSKSFGMDHFTTTAFNLCFSFK